MCFVITDDGAGIDTEMVKKKAVERGLISRSEIDIMSDQDVYRLLFVPGFSMAAVVTDISGRGVGMDVVRRNIDAIKGEITIKSTLGAGTEMCVKFPKAVSLKMFQGFLVRVDKKKYILPVSSIGESFEVRSEEIVSLPDGGKCIMHQGIILPFFRLSAILNGRESGNGMMPVVGIKVISRSKVYVLGVDDILGIQTVLVKEISGLSVMPDAIIGGAILGDENVALALDPDKIYKKGEARAENSYRR
jgi:two-component system, chemotaxis family, sensor kinase CheA